MQRIKTIHQIFFNFDDRSLQDYQICAASQRAFQAMDGWEYCLWGEDKAEKLCQSVYPDWWNTYRSLKYAIQGVDLAKYMIADSCGGVVGAVGVRQQRDAPGLHHHLLHRD